MRRGTIFVLLFVVIVGGVLAASYFFRSQPALTITVAVSPLAEDWVQAAAAAFNETGTTTTATARRVQINVITTDDLQVWTDSGRTWTAANHPNAWIPAASASVGYAVEANYPLEVIQQSMARTLLVWGGFGNAVDQVTQNGARMLDWDVVADAASGTSMSLAFNHPARSMAGLAGLLSAAGSFHETTAFDSGQLVGDFRNWVRPVYLAVPNFTTLGASIAETMASRGQSIGAIALLPESQWLGNLRGQFVSSANAVRLAYPAYSFLFDFPLALYAPNAQTDPNAADIRSGVMSFGAYLMGASAQAQTVMFGLRPAFSDPLETDVLFAAGQPYGAQLAIDSVAMVRPPSRTELQRLLSWANTEIRY